MAREGPVRWLGFEPVDCWPGLSRLWHGAALGGLVVAVAFSLLLNVTLLLWLSWPAMMSSGIKGLLVGSVLAALIGGWFDSRRFRTRLALRRLRDPQLDLFLSARAEYLQGNWEPCERLLERVLLATPEDVEARLMLATLYRHQRRWPEAKEQLRRLQRWSRAAAWNMEIRKEWEQLARREHRAEQLESGESPGLPLNSPTETSQRSAEAA